MIELSINQIRNVEHGLTMTNNEQKSFKGINTETELADTRARTPTTKSQAVIARRKTKKTRRKGVYGEHRRYRML
jgi:hypothetical protein